MRTEKGQFVKGVSSSPATQFKKGEHWRQKKPHWEKEWMVEHYVTQQLSTGDIAKMLETTDANVIYWLRKHGIPRRNVSQARKIKRWGLIGPDNPMFGKRGALASSWKGGITTERQTLYNSLEWAEVVPKVYNKCNFRCVECGSLYKNESKHHIHHIVSFQVKELRTDIDNLILLCKKCHLWTHSNKNVNKKHILTYEQFKERKSRGEEV
ncbi:MAG TPA: HNH endonuclease signature motif containing protein [Fibrella sp.]|jgi:5-methylcytosine-specific restriction endonuclease McrA